MDAAEFLFPRDLEVTKTPLKRVLLIGSCLFEYFKKEFEAIAPEVSFEYVLFNNAYDIPSRSRDDISQYDLCYVQISLRSVLTDGIISANNLKNPDYMQALRGAARSKIDAMLRAALAYNHSFGLLTFVSNFIIPQGRISPSLSSYHTTDDLTLLISDLNNYMSLAIKKYSNVFYLDIDSMANSLGKRFFLDDIMFFSSHNSIIFPPMADIENHGHWAAPANARIERVPPMEEFYPTRSVEFFQCAYRQLESAYRTVVKIDTVKVVIFDLDNTLWRGQIAEHYEPGQEWPGCAGWPLGIWEAIHHLRWRGIITSIASKNDSSLVERKWDDAIQLPILKFSDFVSPQINWNPKVDSIAEILKAVNVTPESAVFVDDNPVERESVRAALPGIRTIGSNPLLSRRILLWSAETQTPVMTNESANREQMIRGQIERDEQKSTMSRNEFLQSLSCRTEIEELTSISQPIFTRTLELVNKTNQFNTTGKRWAIQEFQRFLSDGGRVFTFTVADRFVEYGLVGVVFVDDTLISQFVMSCRVLGMDVESAVLRALADRIAKNIASQPNIINLPSAHNRDGLVSGIIIPTHRNGPCHDLYIKAGFSRRHGESSDQKMIFDLAEDDGQKIAPHVDLTWSAPYFDKSAKAPSDSIEDNAFRYPPVGEVLNGAMFFDGSDTVEYAQAGGWLIPRGTIGTLTYHRYLHPISNARALKERHARFSVFLKTTPNLLEHIELGIDLDTQYTSLGIAGQYYEPKLLKVSSTLLELSWRYTFSGAETFVIAALQVRSHRIARENLSLVLQSQRYELVDRPDIC